MKNAELFSFLFYATLKQKPSVKNKRDRLFSHTLSQASQSSYYRTRFLRRKAPAEWRFYDIWDICMAGRRKIRKQGEARCALNG